MSSLTLFSFESREIRALTIDGNPWFVGKDVAEALGYKDTVNAIKQHCKGVVKHHPLQTAGGTQDVRIINEPDTFRLIVGSNLPEAERFERWLFEDVLPSIRKTGRYEAPNFRDPLSDFGPKAQFAVLEMLVNKVAQEIAGGFIDYLRTQPGRFTPESTPRASYPRHPAPVDLWEPQVAAFVSDRQQVTTTLVLDYLGIPAAEQTQYPKNRIARILKNIGFACCIIKVGRKAQRVWMRTYHA